TLAWAPTFAPLQPFRADWLTSQTRYVRGVVPRRAIHASRAAPCHSSAQPPLLGGLPPPHGAFQEHAAHLVEWSTTLRSKGSSGPCIPEGVATFFHATFTAHSGRDAGGRVDRERGHYCLFSRSPSEPDVTLSHHPALQFPRLSKARPSASRIPVP